VAIRRGDEADHERAVAVWRAANAARRGGRPLPEALEARARRAVSKPDAFLVVADDAGEIVGMAVGMQALADDGAGPPIPGLAHVSMVFVAPERWGEGIGGRLVDAVLAEARARGYARAQLWTRVDNVRAQRLYEGRLFRRSGREMANDLGESIVHYERPL
jgi:ribosomal protein S18 acetylase RimI-like enzyme